jgi:hypothetical protein
MWNEISEPTDKLVETLASSLQPFTRLELKDNIWEYRKFDSSLYLDSMIIKVG